MSRPAVKGMKLKPIITTILVVAAMAVMIRLGFWQLDRLAQRRELNAKATAQMQAAPLTLLNLTGLSESELAGFQYRAVDLSGRFDFSQQIALSNQEWQGHPGVHLITPFILAGSNQAVLIDRGWIPYEESDPSKWNQFAEAENAEIHGRLLLSQSSPWGAPSGANVIWYRIDIPGIQHLVTFQLQPVYVKAAPEGAVKNLPYRSQVTLDLSEGPHMGYALTWFSFSAILGIGSLGYVIGKQKRLMSARQTTNQVQP